MIRQDSAIPITSISKLESESMVYQIRFRLNPSDVEIVDEQTGGFGGVGRLGAADARVWYIRNTMRITGNTSVCPMRSLPFC